MWKNLILGLFFISFQNIDLSYLLLSLLQISLSIRIYAYPFTIILVGLGEGEEVNVPCVTQSATFTLKFHYNI